jgi:hypothetical protein
MGISYTDIQEKGMYSRGIYMFEERVALDLWVKNLRWSKLLGSKIPHGYDIQVPAVGR